MVKKLFLIVPLTAVLMGCRASAYQPDGNAAQAARRPTASSDCSTPGAPKGSSSRVYIALRNGVDGSGNSMTDARDGSTADAFDTILRCYSEGCTDSRNPKKSVAKTENLTVCLGPGTFLTRGNYDYIIGVAHDHPQGFSLGRGWKIHGSGQDKTTIKLSEYLPNTKERNPRKFPEGTGTGLVFGTNADSASDIEISDLTIDANYPELKSRARQNGTGALTLEAIHLRSDQGGHWIHDIKVMNTAGEIGGIHIQWEAFPVWIVSVNNESPMQNSGNVIENVTMVQSFGETGCAIAVANAVVEVRNNQVTGYPIAYGGWKMEKVYFHDNTATETEYGFNIDSLANTDVRIESNQIIHPRKYGIVIGGDAAFSGFQVRKNTLRINQSGVIGLLLRGNVTNAVIADNVFAAEAPGGTKAVAIRSSGFRGAAGLSRNNAYQSNQIAAGMKIVFEPGSSKAQNCFSGNHDERGAPRSELHDNGACR